MPQHSLWDESKHPRDESGEFAEKDTLRSLADIEKEFKKLRKEHASKYGGTKIFEMSSAERPAAMKASQAMLTRIAELHSQILNPPPSAIEKTAKPTATHPADRPAKEPPAPPPRQTMMFDANKTLRLFEGALFEAAKKQKKAKAPVPGPSLLEKIEDDLSSQVEESKPLGGQKEMFCRAFSRQVERYYRNADLRQSISEAAYFTDTNPSPEQKEAGNYRKGKFRWNGLSIAIENPVGSIRRGKSKSGESWQVEMKSHYGYILRNLSEADGDHVDVFVGPHPESDLVCVVDQTRGNGHFDEHKVLIGFTSIKDARAAYLANYSTGWDGLSAITAMTVPQFKQWLECGDTGSRIDGQVSRYAKGRWVTINGTHVYIAGNKVVKGPANLKGEAGRLRGGKPTGPAPLTTGAESTAEAKRRVFEQAESGEEHFDEWDPEEDRAWKRVEIPDDIHFDEWINEDEPQAPPPKGMSRKEAIQQAAHQAAEAVGVDPQEVLQLMPEAQKFLKQEQHHREQAKAYLRKVSGLNAGHLARFENKYRDHSSVKHWDTVSREFASHYPDLGFDPDGDDTPASVWEFLREGKAPYISAYDPKVSELAATWALPKIRQDDRQAGDEDDSHQHVDARSGEAVPFSRRRLAIVAKLSRFFDAACRRMRYSAWREEDHPRGQPENAGEFVASSKPKKILTKNQFIARKQREGVDRREAAKQYIAYRQEHKVSEKPTGEALRIQQEKSKAGQIASQKIQKRMDRRIDTFYEDLPKIHEKLLQSGFVLQKQSPSGSRYYERNGEWIRASDHAPNEATQRWMDSVDCRDVGSLKDLEIV